MAKRHERPRKKSLHQLQVTADKIEAYKEAFDIFDVNKDGLITTSDFGEVMKSFGLNFTEKELSSFIAKANNRDDGNLTFYEFLKILIKDADGSDEEKLFEAFKIFDTDRDGFITPKELKTALAKMGEKLTDKEVMDMVKLADFNGDGKIDYGEFVVMMMDSAL